MFFFSPLKTAETAVVCRKQSRELNDLFRVYSSLYAHVGSTHPSSARERYHVRYLSGTANTLQTFSH